MAQRPIFAPTAGRGLVTETLIDFEWHPGFARVQKLKSIESLREAAQEGLIPGPLLEVSTKSPEQLGVALSAFNLLIDSREFPVPILIEAAFQGSKVFADSGQHTDLYHVTDGREIKRRIKELGPDRIVAFRFEGREWSTEPKTSFYDWLYMRGLALLRAKEPAIDDQLAEFRGFTDIEFNPKKSINCQARSCALHAALVMTLGRPSDVRDLVESPDDFVATLIEHGYGGPMDTPTETLF